MDFRPSVEQEMLRESARRFVTTEQSFEKRQRRLRDGGADDWAQFAELGWLAMAVDEADGGLGSEPTDIALICEELGRELSLEPFIAAGVLPARILGRAERSELVESLLTELSYGGLRVGVALLERESRYQLLQPCLEAVRQVDGTLRLSGSKILVAGGSSADWLIVSARLDGECVLLLVETAQAGVERSSYRTLDDVDAVDCRFCDVSVPGGQLLAFASGTAASLEQALDEARVCLCADVIGGMARAVEMTAEYLKIRSQFGKPLADFQALQHAVAEMFVELSDCRAMLCHALGALSLDESSRRRAVSGCKVKVMETAKEVLGMAIHLHGGIGVTSEYPVGHYLRRALVAERQYGDNEFHLQAYLDAQPRSVA
ncbi:Acryloyl-CoA reductase (NADH) [compost metagenome]